MKKMKRFTAILLAAVLLGGCGQEGVSQEPKTELSLEQSEESTDETKEPEYIDGFEIAEYEKFNSYASENGLGDTLIYIEGKVLNQTKLGDDSDIPTLGLVVEQEDGNRWCVSVISGSEIEGITDKKVKIFGTYLGFSDVMNLPGLAVVVEDEKLMAKARIEVEENGEWVEAWNFYTNYAKAEIDKLNNPDDSAEEESIESETKEEKEGNPKESESNSTITTGQRNALKSAKDYLDFTAFSYEGLVDQLEYEKYSHEDAVYAADNCGADWNEQALKSAKNYLSFTAFSYTGLIQQLEYEQFTKEQATYGADNCGADWNEQAAKSAEDYLSMMSFSKDGLIEQLEYEGFTHEQAVYGAEQNGY